MGLFPPSMQRLIQELSRLPSIGEKSATRLAYHLVQNDKKLAEDLSVALKATVGSVQLCSSCFHLTDSEQCRICLDSQRDSSLICIVEKPMDVIAIERMGEFRGLFHVLHGQWSPLRGKDPSQLKIGELVERIKRGGVREVILATSSTVEGDATALYIARLLTPHGVEVSRLAQGIPKGGELEYADEITLSRALSGRSSVSGGH